MAFVSPARSGLLWKSLAYLLVFLAVAYSVVRVLGGDEYLASADYSLLALGLLCYLAGILCWAIAWSDSSGLGKAESALLTFASSSGSLTPLGLGSDALRGYFSGQSKDGLARVVASSLATKFHKIALTAIVSAVFLVLAAGALGDAIAYSSLFGVAASLAAVLFIWLVSSRSSWLLRLIPPRFLPQSITGGSALFHKLFSSPSAYSIAFLLLSLAFEFAAFLFCFLAFGVYADLAIVAGVFVAVFFASKVPLVNGFGLVELVGVALLHGAFPVSRLLAVLFAFDLARLWFPAFLSVFFVASKVRQKRG